MRKIRKIIVISMLILILISLLAQNTYAAMEVKAKTSETSAKTSITVSNSFAYCYNLRASSTTLGNNTLDPHLTLNSDWGAVAYLAASVYGINGTSTDTIISTTTGNESGVKDLGKTLTATSSILTSAWSNNNLANVFNNKNTKYVEVLAASKSNISNLGKAMYETNQWSGTKGTGTGSTDYPTTSTYYWGDYVPIIVRYKVFSSVSADGASDIGSGGSRSDVAFRPVIWN